MRFELFDLRLLLARESLVAAITSDVVAGKGAAVRDAKAVHTCPTACQQILRRRHLRKHLAWCTKV